LAGQIPLIPATLTLPPPMTSSNSPYVHQSALAVQHVDSIIDVLRSKNNTGGGWTGWGESCVAWWTRDATSGGEGLGVAREVWRTWAEKVSHPSWSAEPPEGEPSLEGDYKSGANGRTSGKTSLLFLSERRNCQKARW